MNTLAKSNSEIDNDEKLSNKIQANMDMKVLNENVTVQPSIGKQTIPSAFYEKLLEDRKVWTHGYLHGHIHRHKDHTHIHGHIHNHDHDHHNQQTQLTESGPLTHGFDSGACNEFEEYPLCDDIFCDELDDCFYFQCDGTKEEERLLCSDECVKEIDDHTDCDDSRTKEDGCKDCVKCCEDPSCLDTSSNIKEKNICNDPSCIEGEVHNNSSFECCQDALGYNHENNLCDLQLSKKSIFENLINKAHNSLETKETSGEPEPSLKRRKLQHDTQENETNLQVHFPHLCHPTPEINNSLNVSNELYNLPSNHHHVHQSCFHASIPNFDNNALEALTDENLGGEKSMSDYDFFIQFNNFNNFLDLQKHGQQGNISGNGFSMLENPVELKIPDSQLSEDSTSPKYSCQWDNCFKTISDGTFMKHVVDQHIGQEYNLNNKQLKPESLGPFQCEWNECNYMNTDLNSLLEHLNCHKRNDNPLEENINMLTPTSTDKSNILSPNNPSFSQSKVSNDINITSIKVSPQHKNNSCCSHAIDKDFTCKWQTGFDEVTGSPILCNRIHSNSGELHSHLVDDHIGLGKSLYSCNWVGCERHNGKGFRQRQKLLRHIHIHTNHKPCKCEICGSTFAVDSMLKQHLRIHSGEKPFKCTICGKTFATGSSLSIHNRIHTGEKPLVCKWPGCGKRFSESSNLTKHMKIHMKAFDCEICGELFDKKAHYTKHMKLHKKGDIQHVLPVTSEMNA